MFVTTTVGPDSPPNCAFLADQDGISDKVLDTPNIHVNSATAQLTFRHSYNMESSDADYDGCVLEVSSPNVNGGTFTDITDAAVGGSFVTGGYNVTIFTGASNPLEGRMAWGNTSNGYITTTVNLGSILNGQNVKFRFRMGTDEASTGPGWRIDTLSLTNASCP